MKTPFEDYLKHVHGELYPEILDDNLPDHFDDWVSGLDGAEVIHMADEAMNIQSMWKK